MKTAKQNIIHRREILSIFLIIASSFILLTGCQKDEMPQVSNSADQSQASMERKGIASNEDEFAKPFTMLEIDHVAMFSALPDYKIQLMSNGRAIFTGRKNTALIGQIQFEVAPKIAAEIRAMYLKANLSELANMTPNIDLPFSSTSFRANSLSDIITKSDYNKGTLKDLREKTEQLLDISKLVNRHRTLTDLPAGANMEHN